MLQYHSDRQRRHWVKLCIAVGLIVFTASCAGVGSGPDRVGHEQTRTKNHPLIKVDSENGFTVTEVVRIDSDIRDDYQQAMALLRQNRLEEGITLLKSVVERAPEVTTPHIDLGVAYRTLGAFDKAQQSLQSALKMAPNHPVALNELGIVYRQTGQFDAARSSYERALAIHPYFHYALLNLGMLCDLYIEDLACALRYYQSYAGIVSNDEQVGMWIADVRNRLSVNQ